MNKLSVLQLDHLTQGELALLTFECMSALSSSEAKWRELKEQGKLTRLFRSLNGKNNTLRMAMHENFITAQKNAMNIIGQLVKGQTLSFSVISSLHEKVLQLQLENDRKFFSLYQTLEMMYEESAEKFKQLHSRMYQLEKKVSLIDWRQSLSYMTYHSIPYKQLRPEEKVVCAVNDFYHATKGNWQQEDEKYLEYMLLDLQLDKPIISAHFYERLSQNKALFERLRSGIQLAHPIDAAIYGEEPLILLLNQQRISLHRQKAQRKIPSIELAMQLLTQLAIIEQASRVPIGYELVLASIPHVNDRLRINRTLHLEGGIPLDQCPSITNNTPVTVSVYHSLQEANTLKKALEQNKCQVHLMEVF